MSTAGIVSRGWQILSTQIKYIPLHCCFLCSRQSGEVWWCFLVLTIGTAPSTLSHPSLLDWPILLHNANCVFCQSMLHLAHMVPALSLSTVTSLLNFWTSKHRLILHRQASPIFAWAFNTVTHIFSHPRHIFQLILCPAHSCMSNAGAHKVIIEIISASSCGFSVQIFKIMPFGQF